MSKYHHSLGTIVTQHTEDDSSPSIILAFCEKSWLSLCPTSKRASEFPWETTILSPVATATVNESVNCELNDEKKDFQRCCSPLWKTSFFTPTHYFKLQFCELFQRTFSGTVTRYDLGYDDYDDDRRCQQQ